MAFIGLWRHDQQRTFTVAGLGLEPVTIEWMWKWRFGHWPIRGGCWCFGSIQQWTIRISLPIFPSFSAPELSFWGNVHQVSLFILRFWHTALPLLGMRLVISTSPISHTSCSLWTSRCTYSRLDWHSPIWGFLGIGVAHCYRSDFEYT